jgi:hypothetical protein
MTVVTHAQAWSGDAALAAGGGRGGQADDYFEPVKARVDVRPLQSVDDKAPLPHENM